MQNLNRILSQKEPHNEFQNTKTSAGYMSKKRIFFSKEVDPCFDLLKKINPTGNT